MWALSVSSKNSQRKAKKWDNSGGGLVEVALDRYQIKIMVVAIISL